MSLMVTMILLVQNKTKIRINFETLLLKWKLRSSISSWLSVMSPVWTSLPEKWRENCIHKYVHKYKHKQYKITYASKYTHGACKYKTRKIKNFFELTKKKCSGWIVSVKFRRRLYGTEAMPALVNVNTTVSSIQVTLS